MKIFDGKDYMKIMTFMNVVIVWNEFLLVMVLSRLEDCITLVSFMKATTIYVLIHYQFCLIKNLHIFSFLSSKRLIIFNFSISSQFFKFITLFYQLF